MDEFFGVLKKLLSLYSVLSEMNPVRVINKKNSVALVRERNIPIERPMMLFYEVSAMFCR
jgi:hypothetical protein